MWITPQAPAALVPPRVTVCILVRDNVTLQTMAYPRVIITLRIHCYLQQFSSARMMGPTELNLIWAGSLQTEEVPTVNVSSMLLRHCCYLCGQATLISQRELYVSRNNRFDWVHSLQGVRLHGPAPFNRWYLSEGTLPRDRYHWISWEMGASFIN